MQECEEYHQSLFSWSRPIKTVNCNISEAVNSLPGTTFWLTSPVNDFKPLNWCFQRRDPPQSSSDSAPSVGPEPASHHRDRQYTDFQKRNKWKAEQGTGHLCWKFQIISPAGSISFMYPSLRISHKPQCQLFSLGPMYVFGSFLW